jgi:rare lipoprotein A
VALSSCTLAGPPAGAPAPAPAARVPEIRDVVPVAEPLSLYGNPEEYVVDGVTYRVLETARGYVEEGQASWYGEEFHGRRTSSGEPFDMYAMSAAHRSLPLPTYVRVTNLDNGLGTVVRVNDRGPFHGGRIIDLSWAAASKLGMIGPGTARVRVRALEPVAR